VASVQIQTLIMNDDYDFSKGIRGKYAKQIAEGTNVVVLDPEVAKMFPTSEAVNKALRKLIEDQKELPDRTDT